MNFLPSCAAVAQIYIIQLCAEPLAIPALAAQFLHSFSAGESVEQVVRSLTFNNLRE